MAMLLAVVRWLRAPHRPHTSLRVRCNLCEVNPDGTGQRAFTTDGGGAAGSYSTPSLSRDGTLLAFDEGNTAYAMTMPGGTRTT